jgi:lambda family phage minor tail protein L
MTIPSADLQKLYHSGVISLYELDLTPIAGSDVYRFCNYADTDGANVSFGGIEYQAIAIAASGFEINTNGQLPTPTLRVSNVYGLITSLVGAVDDLVGARLTRRRTLIKYLDGQPSEDPDTAYPDDIWYIERKVREDKLEVEFQLASSFDLEGLQLPGRLQLANTCTWTYKGDGCGYTGGPVAKIDDTATSDSALDDCGKRVSSCKLRFGENGVLKFSSYPGLQKG